VTSFDQASLASAAGVDPWALLAKLHSGDPAQIEALAAAFYKAGGDMSDAQSATKQSQAYVTAGYKVQGAAPLDFDTSAAETKASIAGGADHLPAIAKILGSVATDLDTATRKAQGEVDTLNGLVGKYESEWNNFFQTTGHHLPEEDWLPVKQSYVNDAVAAVRSHGGTVKDSFTGYETTLGHSLKSMADLGYIPPDAVDEGPGDVNLDNPNGDAQTTIDAAKNGDAAALQNGVSTVALINAAIKANHGRVDDEEYSYLYQYYDKTAPYSAQIYSTVKDLGADAKEATGAQWADGLLNLSNGGEQNTDSGVTPNSYLPGGELIGRSGVPPSVAQILNSDIGAVQASPQFAGADDSPMLRRAEWKDGHWVVDNYAADTGFADLLNMADHGVQGGTDFSKSLAEAGLRWKQDINAVQTNTSTWLDAAHLYYDYPDVSSSDDDAQALGFPPDTDPDHLHLGLDDTGASNALSVGARNSYAAAEVLTDEADRHAVLGLNWQDGYGAGDLIASGTAPDPHNEAIDPDTGQSIRNEAALDVIKDTGSDYEHFVQIASDPVKNALTNLAINHLDSFATVPEGGGSSTVGTLVLPNGQHVAGVSLDNDDASNFLKMIAMTGPQRYGALHAAALQQGALWIHEAPGHDSNSGANYASILDGRVSTAGFAAAQDIAQHSNAEDKSAYAAQLAEEQDQSTKEMLGKIAFQTVDAGLDLVSFGASDHVKDALETVGSLNGILGTGYDDYNEFNSDDVNSEYIQHLQQQMQQALSAPQDQAQVTYGVQQDQAWMAIKAAAMDPNHSAALNQSLDAYGNPALPPGVLQGPDHSVSPSVDTSNAQYAYLTSEAGKRDVINPLLDHTYGSTANSDSWGAEGINATLAGRATDEPVAWTDGPIVAQTSTGGNKIVYWLPGRDPTTWMIEQVQDATPH
jgi:hypothetical protein